MGFFDSIGNQFKAAWARLSIGHRVILILLTVVCVGGMAAVSMWAGAPDYDVVAAGLGGQEAAELASAIREEGVDARLAASGDAVLVPSSKLPRARMVTAGRGVASDLGKGFSAFKSPKIGMTPFAERINYLSALQEELAATISALGQVTSARVHLVVPERTLFKNDARKPSASVLVTTAGGERLSNRHATAIANLVANAVEGLAPQDVTISDGQGNVLAGGREHGPETSAGDQWSYRRKVEDDLAEKAESMLTRLLGRGRCEVRVSAELDFENSKETRRDYSPASRVVVSERIESSQSTGGGGRAGGAAGTGSNVPGQGQGGSAVAGSETETENIDTKYVVGESVREVIVRGATIKRISVAAMVDLSPPENGAQGPSGDGAESENAEDVNGGNGSGSAVQTPMPTMADIESIIKDAVGFDQARGDSLKLVQARLVQPAEAAAPSGHGMPLWVEPVARYGAIAVLGLVLLTVARRVLGNLESAAPRQVIVPEVMNAEEGSGTGQGQLSQMSQEELLRREIARIVQSDPRSAGRLLEGWIEGGE